MSAPTIGLFGLKLVTNEQLDLILIAVLILVFQESAFGVIRYLEYAFRLPESCKRDPEYVQQMDNMLNTHLKHTFGFLGLTGVATMVALGFHSVLLGIVSDSTGSQWAGQVSESIELSLDLWTCNICSYVPFHNGTIPILDTLAKESGG